MENRDKQREIKWLRAHQQRGIDLPLHVPQRILYISDYFTEELFILFYETENPQRKTLQETQQSGTEPTAGPKDIEPARDQQRQRKREPK